MLEKFEILIVIFALLVAFYIVITLGASFRGKFPKSKEIVNYLFGVRILIIFIAVISIILWLFL